MSAGALCFLSKKSQGSPDRELDDARVLAFHDFGGRGKTSGIAVEQTRSKGACLFNVRDGKVMKLLLYSVRDRALGFAADTGT